MAGAASALLMSPVAGFGKGCLSAWSWGGEVGLWVRRTEKPLPFCQVAEEPNDALLAEPCGLLVLFSYKGRSEKRDLVELP